MRLADNALLSAVLAMVIASTNVNAAFRFPFNAIEHKNQVHRQSLVRRDDVTPTTRHRLFARADSPLTIKYTGTGYVPKSYIVVLDAPLGSSQVAQQQAEFVSFVKQRLNVQLRRSYNVLLNAVVLDVLDGNEWSFNLVTSYSGVKQVKPVTSGSSHTPIVHSTGYQRHLSRLQRRQSIGGNTDTSAGQGVKVGIVDSGIDYTHSALGGCFGAGCKVAYGYDFVGDAYTGASWPSTGWQAVPDTDPRDVCNGHGTHVAGLVAASSSEVTGAAPAATLGAYRVLGCTGGVGIDVLISALERAATDGMDVVNISIGTGKFFTDGIDSLAAQALIARGITVVASAGNDGITGLTTISSPGLAPDVISVASTSDSTTKAFSFTLDDDSSTIHYLAANRTYVPTATYKTVKRVELSNPDGCAPYTASYSGKVVVLNRGNCDFTTKAVNAQNAKALGIFIVNTDNTLVTPVVDTSAVNIYTLVIRNSDGKKLYNLLSSESSSTTIRWRTSTADYTSTASYQSSAFGSNGPTVDITNVKPDLSYFGESIYSTYPVALGSYALLSGTSLAAPQVAGLAAALIQKLGSTVPAVERPLAVRRLLTQTTVSKPAPDMAKQLSNSTSYTSSIPFSGSGIAQGLPSTEKAWGLSPLSLGFVGSDEGGSAAAQTFTIKLTGNIPAGTITFRHIPGVAISNWDSRARTSLSIDAAPSAFSANPNSISVSASSVTNPNQIRSESTTITLYPPYQSGSSKYFIFNGLIEAVHKDASTGVQTVRHIPYQTSRGAQQNIGPLHRVSSTYPRLDYIDPNGVVSISSTNNRLVNDGGEYVALRFRLETPSPWAFVVVEDTNGNILGVAADAYGGALDATKSDVNDDQWSAWTGLIQPMPSFNQFDDTISAVADGQYKLRLFTFRPFIPFDATTSTVRSNYDTWLSGAITVKGIANVFSKGGANLAATSAKNGGVSSSVLTKAGNVDVDSSVQTGTIQLLGIA